MMINQSLIVSGILSKRMSNAGVYRTASCIKSDIATAIISHLLENGPIFRSECRNCGCWSRHLLEGFQRSFGSVLLGEA